MNPIEILKKTNTVLIFVLLVGTIFFGGYLIKRSREPIKTVHVTIDSLRIHKK
jgi:hypothetical protein